MRFKNQNNKNEKKTVIFCLDSNHDLNQLIQINDFNQLI